MSQTGRRAVNITKADTDIAKVDGMFPSAIFVGTAGDVSVLDIDGNASTWTMPAGGYVLCTVKQVKVASTAGGFVAIYNDRS